MAQSDTGWFVGRERGKERDRWNGIVIEYLG